MYLQMEMPLGDEGEITLTIDTNKSPNSITLRLADATKQVIIDDIEPHKFGQFVINARQLITMAHHDDLLSDEEDEEDEDVE